MTIEPWHWLILGVLLLIAEMFIPTFAALWFGVAALAVALLAWLLPLSLTWQILIWLALSIVCVWVWFKFINPLSPTKTKAGLGGSVIIGEVGMMASVPVADKMGVVRFSVPVVGATEWLCRVQEGHSVSVGERVVVTNILGNELIVKPFTTNS